MFEKAYQLCSLFSYKRSLIFSFFKLQFDSETGTPNINNKYGPVTVFSFTEDENGVQHPQYSRFKTRIVCKPLPEQSNIDSHKFKPKSDIVSLVRYYNDMMNLLQSPAAGFDLQHLNHAGQVKQSKQIYTYLGKSNSA